MSDFWVFGYGSLMWRPDFAHLEARTATVHGWHRSMCILSTRYRGTPDAPGLVLGLDRGGICRGMAFRVAADRIEEVKRILHEREMITNVYETRMMPARLDDGRRVAAYSFVARRDHPQYVGRLGPEAAARLIRDGCGAKGMCREYLENTVRHLEELGIRDASLMRLLSLVRAPQPSLQP
jgi:cation transport protein ChaC